MTDPNDNLSNQTGADPVGRLIQHAGAREAVPEERRQRVRQAVQAHWEQVVAEQKPARRTNQPRLFAIAASLIMALVAGLVFFKQAPVPGESATASIERVLGEVMINGQPVVPGSAIGADIPITTSGNGRIALRLSGGQSLRLDTASRVVLHSANHVSLEAGALYIDTALASPAGPVLVTTPVGTARDIGTQFQVRLTASAMVVGVRDGLVVVAQEGQQSLTVNKGYSLELDNQGEHQEQALLAGDPDWEWVDTIAPEFNIQDAKLDEYLRWYANERGYVLRWEDRTSEDNARQAVLSGSIAGYELDDGLEIVKQVAPFEHRLSGDEFWVKVE